MNFLFQSKRRGLGAEGDFAYLEDRYSYFDSACQTLRPQCVIDAEVAYYHHYNACGGRVKYRWGEEVDSRVAHARSGLLSYLGKSSQEYDVVFTLNTTYGVNLVLQQLNYAAYDRIITSEIEHNSVFLPSIVLAQRHSLARDVLARGEDGSLEYKKGQLDKAIVLVNSCSNIDGRQLNNAKELARDVHEQGGVLCIDAAQGMVTQRALLSGIDFDCLFGSSHKMYGPSLGFIVIKRSLLSTLTPFFVGGGMVESVRRDEYTLIQDPSQLHSRLELGLQNWAGIIGFDTALDWLMNRKAQNIESCARALSQQLYEGLREIPGVTLVNTSPSSVISWYPDRIDAHQIALMYSAQDIMVRSGYFCCHYYLQEVKKLPPLVRASLGLHSTSEQVEQLLATTRTILHTFR